MQNNALWLVLVMILGTSVLVLVLPDDEAVSVNEDDTKDETEEETVEESTCLVGTQKVLNAPDRQLSAQPQAAASGDPFGDLVEDARRPGVHERDPFSGV